jgi:hypothetical protein
LQLKEIAPVLERLRRHPLLTFLTLLLCGAGAALTLFLYSFDLNDYRSQFQARLQAALKRPVQIGAMHFALRHGLSLDLSATTIGAPEDATSLTVDHLVLVLRIAPLWQRQLSFTSVLLEGVQFRIVAPTGASATLPPEVAPEQMNTLIDLFQSTKISTLILHNGRATIVAGERRYDLDKIELQIHNIAFHSPITIAAGGEVHIGALRAPWQLAGDIEMTSAAAPWQETRINLALGVNGLDLAQLPQALGREPKDYQLGGVAHLNLRTQGAPASGLTFMVRAEGKDLSLALPAHYQAPLRGQEAVFSGIWQSGEPGTIRDLLLRLDTFSLRGEAVLPTAGTPLVATLALADAPLVRLGQLIPDRTLPLLAATLRGPEVGGSAGLTKIDLRWSMATGLHLGSIHAHLRDGRFTLKGIGLLAGVEGDGTWRDGALTIKNAKADLLGGKSEGSGNMTFPHSGEPIFNLKIASTLRAEALTPLLPAIWQAKLQMQGPLTFTGKVSGTSSRLLLDLQSRFDDAVVRINSIPLKQAGEVGELLILGATSPAGLELSHAHLLLPFGEARANGRLALDSSGSYTLACDISNLRIEKLPPFLLVQEKLQGHGEVDLRLDFSGDQRGLKSLQGSGDFRKLGIHLWDAVANLHDGSGRMLLSREGIDFPVISGFLGLSPVRASAELKWLPEFKLTLDLDLARTRAADLVFKSPQKTFDSIRGRLIISRTEILFEKISAEIVGETAARINGRLTYAPASLVLDIAANRADVAGIIALWQGGEKPAASAPSPSPNARPLSVEIATKIATGDLYGVTFQNAIGKIALRKGKLIIQPLRLEIGAGRATVAVAVGPLHAEHPLLTVSGQAEKIDAARVQKQLLGRQGSITGTLASTFYLQGEIGRFLPTCTGNVNLHLNQGLLRGFTSLSRALALFNVGKILTFNVPDVAREGLLFDRIIGNLTFTDGVAKSEDLAVTSPAFDMAFIGKADLAQDQLDFLIGVKPLQTVDKVLSNIPLAGWILTGEKKAFVVANFHVTGSSQDPKVEAIPFSSLSDMAVGIFKRTFGLPSKIVNDVTELFK